MRRILVAVDGSEESLRAVDFASSLAARCEARVVVVHVALPLYLPPSPRDLDLDRLQSEHDAHALQVARVAAERARVAGAVDPEQLVLPGAAPEVIADLSADPDVWMIVAGSRGLGAVQRFLLGSVSERLLRIATKPVLIVR